MIVLHRQVALFLGGLITVFSLTNMAYASNQKPAGPQVIPIALIGGTIHTVTGDIIENGTILFEKGKIVGLGLTVEIPENALRISVEGKHIYPGLIAAHSIIGLTEIGAVRATRDNAEIGDITPSVRTPAAVNPESEYFPVTRANGILVALSTPSGGLIAGQSGLIMMDGWTWEEMTLKSPVAMHIYWPSYRIRTFPGADSEEDQIKQRDKQLKKLRDAFQAARAYKTAKEAEGQSNIPYHDSDLSWEAMIPVINKDIPVLVHASDVKQIQAAIDWAIDEEVRMVLVGGTDAWRVTDRLKKYDIPVIIGGVLRLPGRRWEDFDTPFTNALKLYQAGVRFCISDGGGGANERNLPYHAATAAAYGLPKDEALKSVTIYPAEILGVADQVGSLEENKDATLIVTDGDPLEIRTHVELAFIQGRPVDLSSKHTDLYDKYLERLDQVKN